MASLSQVRRARAAAHAAGVKRFYLLSGGCISVWYPMEGRFHNVEEEDLEKVIEAIRSGELR